MPPKQKCYTKPKKDGGTYTTCVEGQKKKKKLKILKPIEKKKVKPLTEKQLLEKHGKFLGEHQKKEKEKVEAKPKKEKIDYDEVEESSSFLSGVDMIYDFSDFFTYSEERVSTELAQERAIYRSSIRMNKFIQKALKKLAKQKKIKSTDEYIKFLDSIKKGSQLRDLLAKAVSK